MNKLEQAITLVMLLLTPNEGPSKKNYQKCMLDKHWTNQCSSEEKKAPKKADSSKTPWHLVPPDAGTTHIATHGIIAVQIVLHLLGDIINQVVNTRSLLST
eukprot:10883564-Ditylum_brightwellii.AAC.1